MEAFALSRIERRRVKDFIFNVSKEALAEEFTDVQDRIEGSPRPERMML